MSTNLFLPAVVTAIVGLLVMESYQITPWLADKLMQWSVHLRYTDNPERVKVRGEELIALLGDLPTLFKLPTAVGFLLRALVYRLANRRGHARREPRAVQRSLGVRFRIALVKAVLVAVCAGAVFELELVLTIAATGTVGPVPSDLLWLVLVALFAGIPAAIESVIQPSRFPHGTFGGIMHAFLLFIYLAQQTVESALYVLCALCGGMAFGVATMLTCTLIRKFKYVGVIVGILVNIVGVASAMLAYALLPMDWLVWGVVVFSGLLGVAGGVLAGFAIVMIRRSDLGPAPAVLDDSLSGSGAVNPELLITIGQPPRQE